MGRQAWYVELSRNGYPDVARFARDVRPGAFYPLMPALIRSVSTVTGLPAVAAGVAIALTTGAAAVLVVWQLTRELAGRVAADRATTLLAFFHVIRLCHAVHRGTGHRCGRRGDPGHPPSAMAHSQAVGSDRRGVASQHRGLVAALAAAAWDRPRRAWTAQARSPPAAWSSRGSSCGHAPAAC